MANGGPLPQADLLAVYRRLMTATRELETATGHAPRLATAMTPDRRAGRPGAAQVTLQRDPPPPA